MAKSFEDMDVWIRARELVNFIYAITGNERFRKDFSLTDQIRRAAVSVMSNIAEGFERGSNTEFIQFLYIAKGSAGETRTQLYIALDQGYINQDEFHKGKEQCINVSGQISGLIQYLKGSSLKGDKFRTEYKSFRDEVNTLVNEFNKNKK
ncbi:MAG: four helix bundle protein [Nitrospirae bacterium]|nr:four helix bundle protein [Nitrospirota bacterium]